MARKATGKGPRRVEALTHDAARRRNIPTAELQSVAERAEEADPPPPVRYERARPLNPGERRERDGDLDPQIIWRGADLKLNAAQIKALKAGETVTLADAQLAWRGKDTQDWSDLVVEAPPVYVQEKIHPRHIIEDLKKQTRERQQAATDAPDLFDIYGDFNGLDAAARTEFYRHDQNWQNRMILGDSLQVMASLAERESLRGGVQCIYMDPPYGIKFQSNWQVSTRSRDVKDGKADQITREPEQVRAFRDTWKDGIHSYLTYLRDRLTVARDLLADSGSIFVQIGDENVHRVRALMDEVFGEENFVSLITIKTSGGLGSSGLKSVSDFIAWYARSKPELKIRKLLAEKRQGDSDAAGTMYYHAYDPESLITRPLSKAERNNPGEIPQGVRTFRNDNLVSSGFTPTCIFDFGFEGKNFPPPGGRSWKTNLSGMERLVKADRISFAGKNIHYRRYIMDFPVYELNNIWQNTAIRTDKQYVVETATEAIKRCILMSTDPGDLVLDPTCGSGTTATVAEQWGRRWITMDTSRVALALARTRLMAARYPYYLLADSEDGRRKEAEVTGKLQPATPPPSQYGFRRHASRRHAPGGYSPRLCL